MRELYRAVYHILLFVVVKVDFFSIDFHFYDIRQNLFFFGKRSDVSSTILQSLLKKIFCESKSNFCKFGKFCDSITVNEIFFGTFLWSNTKKCFCEAYG